MIISAHQPAYLPWLGLFHKVMLSDLFVIMDDVQFEKNSFTNRNRILSAGRDVLLTVPVRSRGHTEKTIAQLEVDGHRWNRKHLRTIEQAYRKAPHFDDVFGRMSAILVDEYPRLIDYTNRLFRFFLDYIGIDTPIQTASELDIRSRKLDYVIELTRKVDGSVFVFGTLGRGYADETHLRQAGIEPCFQDYRHPAYRQAAPEFVPNMCILDLAFNEPRERLAEIIMQGNVTRDDLYRRFDLHTTAGSGRN